MASNVRKFTAEASFAVLSQGLSMGAGFALSIILPKYIPIDNYGYWQLFILYTGYVGFLHFGFIDGLYLKLGGKKFDEIDRDNVYPVMLIMIVQQVFASLAVLLASYFFETNDVKQTLFYYLALFVFIDNTYKLLSFVLMATGRINKYSKSVIIDKLLMAGLVFVIVIIDPDADVGRMVAAFILSHAVVLYMVAMPFKGLFAYGMDNLRRVFPDYIGCIKVGSILMFSNLCGSFIVGSGRLVIESYWDIGIFAKVSLALALSSFLMAFISQISYVLFPYLRNASLAMQKKVLVDGTFVLTSMGIILISLFFPIYYIVRLWLPQYELSLHFLLFLSPIAFYEIRTNLLYNTFFRNLNKVYELFYINFSSLLVGAVLYIVAVYIENIMLMVLGMLIAVMFKCLVMQKYLFSCYKICFDKSTYVELVISAVLISSYSAFGVKTLFCVYVASVAAFITLFRNKIIDVAKELKNRR